MGHPFEQLRNLVEKLRAIHRDERAAKIESMLIVGVLASQNAAVHFGMSYEQFLTYIGLTKNQYWKRAQAATVCRFHPEALAMLRANEVEMSHLALVSAKITQANKDYILSGIRHASTRAVKLLLARVTLDGRIVETEPEIELTIKVTQAQLAVLDRIREVRSHGGHVPTWGEVVAKDAELALEKLDPMRKAERAKTRCSVAQEQKQRVQKTTSSEAKATVDVEDLRASEFVGSVASSHDERNADAENDATSGRPSSAKGATPSRPAVPAAIRHAVWLRDQGMCTWRFADGSCCGTKQMLELDHMEMWCRGGEHSVHNLTLRCRSHNRFSAEQQLGAWFMSQRAKTSHAPH